MACPSSDSLASMEAVLQEFREVDANDDGTISRVDLRLILQELNPELTGEHFEKLLEEVPLEDGAVRYEEFVRLLFAEGSDKHATGNSTEHLDGLWKSEMSGEIFLISQGFISFVEDSSFYPSECVQKTPKKSMIREQLDGTCCDLSQAGLLAKQPATVSALAEMCGFHETTDEQPDGNKFIFSPAGSPEGDEEYDEESNPQSVELIDGQLVWAHETWSRHACPRNTAELSASSAAFADDFRAFCAKYEEGSFTSKWQEPDKTIEVLRRLADQFDARFKIQAHALYLCEKRYGAPHRDYTELLRIVREMSVLSRLYDHYKEHVDEWAGYSFPGITNPQELQVVIGSFKSEITKFSAAFLENGPMVQGIDAEEALKRFTRFNDEYESNFAGRHFRVENESIFSWWRQLLGLPADQNYEDLDQSSRELGNLKKLFDLYVTATNAFKEWRACSLHDFFETHTGEIDGFAGRCKRIPRNLRQLSPYTELVRQIDPLQTSLVVAHELASAKLKPRHEKRLESLASMKQFFPAKDIKVGDVIQAVENASEFEVDELLHVCEYAREELSEVQAGSISEEQLDEVYARLSDVSPVVSSMNGDVLDLVPQVALHEGVTELKERVSKASGLRLLWTRLCCNSVELRTGSLHMAIARALATDSAERHDDKVVIQFLQGPPSPSVFDHKKYITRDRQLTPDAFGARPSFLKLGKVAFPEPQDININMMPFILDDSESLPEEYRHYWPLIDHCFSGHDAGVRFMLPEDGTTQWTVNDRSGKIGFLTIQEGKVLQGTSQRRPGIHTDCPGVQKKGGSLRPYFWGGGYDLSGGIFMASTVRDSCKVWGARIADPGEVLGWQGSLEHIRPILGDGASLDAGELCWITDLTPHESVPVAEDTYRQFFRLVTHSVSVWYQQNSTKNRLGVVPDPAITEIITEDKFSDLQAKSVPAGSVSG